MVSSGVSSSVWYQLMARARSSSSAGGDSARVTGGSLGSLAVLMESSEQILGQTGPGDLVLDVGGWASPFRRADWVLDLMPYDTRGLYGPVLGGQDEHFSARTWVQRDICERTPWPFEDHQFDFVVCAHTLEDVRDPVWVCSELQRVGRAGYVEVPSRLEEQAYGVQGPWVGWGHHHWLCDLNDGGIEFVFKHHVLQGQPQAQFSKEFHAGLGDRERVLELWWSGSLPARERIFTDAGGLDGYLADFVAAHQPAPALHRRLFRRRG